MEVQQTLTKIEHDTVLAKLSPLTAKRILNKRVNALTLHDLRRLCAALSSHSGFVYMSDVKKMLDRFEDYNAFAL